MWKIIFSVLVAMPISAFYSNGEASDCFESDGIMKCFHLAKPCLDDPACNKEVSTYQKCSFGPASVIFNGNCFKEWVQNAVLTKSLIDCLNEQCNLLYNSDIGVQTLDKRIQDLIDNGEPECDEDCMKELNQVRASLLDKQISQVASNKLENPSADKIWQQAYSQCLHQKQSPQLPQTDNKQPQIPTDQQL